MAHRVAPALALMFLLLPGSAAADPSFMIEPFPPTAGDPATLTAQEAGDAPRWDLDEDDDFELEGTALEHSFSSPGQTQVRMQATDGTIVTKDFVVNAPPVAAFGFSPSAPFAGQGILFASEASDPDGAELQHHWDFGDGSFSSAVSIEHAFSSPGTKIVLLTVTDERGAVRSVSRQVLVVPPPPLSLPPVLLPADPDPQPAFIRPFPVVRLAGEVGRRATVVQLLEVRAPRGSLVRVRCRGADCPASTIRRRIGVSGRVRFPGFERSLAPGTRLAIFVRHGDEVGKYTRFAIRRGKRPRRTDLCLVPDLRWPVSCDQNLQR